MYIHLTNFSVNKKGDVPNDYPDGLYYEDAFNANSISFLTSSCNFRLPGEQVDNLRIVGVHERCGWS